MLTREGCLARRRRLFDAFSEQPDWVVLFDPQNLMYFANYFQTPFVYRSANAAAALIMGGDGSSILVCDNQLKVFADEAYADEVIAPVWYRGRESAPHRRSHLVGQVLERLKQCAGSHFLLEGSAVPAAVVEGLRASQPNVRITLIDEVLHALKRSKDADELEVMRRAIHAGDVAFDTALRKVQPGMSELEVFLLVQQTAQQTLGEQAQLYGDFVSGPRCETGGGPPSERVIEAGDLVLIDFSVIVRGYRGDCANTFVCAATPTAEQRRLHEACLEAMSAGEALLRAGQSCREIDRAVRDSLAARHLAENFTSHAGHGLGLGHPDPPYIVPDSVDTLVAGDIVTLEPGQYIRGTAGMRYERNYRITETGYEVLSQLKLQIDQNG
jgi:Xaa-Pro aminopeptidase